MKHAVSLRDVSWEQIGDDLMVLGYVERETRERET
jgi:hypothetical protein